MCAIEALPVPPFGGGPEAAAGPQAPGVVALWQERIRRVLLVAHVLPASFGLLAVTALVHDGHPRPIDVAVWAGVVGWTLFLLIGGWQRTAGRAYLARWVLADATVMAVLQFIGTPARGVVSYASIDGALFAAVFISTTVALTQITIVESGLAAAAVARHLGMHTPSPLIGWMLPLAVPLAGVFVLRFLRQTLDALSVAMSGREQAVARERELLAEAAAQEAVVREVGVIEETLGSLVSRLGQLVTRYGKAVARASGASAEAGWLAACLSEATSSLTSLREVLAEVDVQPLEEAIDTGILGASAIRVLAGNIERRVEPVAGDLIISADTARAVSGFVREAVTNSLTHGASPVVVEATCDEHGRVRVGVQDHGAGFVPAHARGGLGLAALEQYAIEAQAELRHTHPSGGGHAVELWL